MISAFFSSVAFGNTVDLGLKAAATPYDLFLSPVKSVLQHIDRPAGSANLNDVKRLMRIGRDFRYSYSSANPYTPKAPEATAAQRAGDCKDKALWLANALDDSSIRFVIGKASRGSRLSHAWLYWQDSSSRWWILDCTMNSAPIPADKVSANRYIPLYSYSKTGEFRHGLGATVASVASHREAGVATNR
ncbi:MAG: hypothetical protein QM796_11940 [Chthoniobacteraceae bacterium]